MLHFNSAENNATPVKRRASVDLVPHNENSPSESSDLRNDDFIARLIGSWYVFDLWLNEGKPYPIEVRGLALLVRSSIGFAMSLERADGPPLESSELELSHFSTSGGV
jgi:hypothetical protein